MSILSIFRRPAVTADALRAKITELRDMQPALAAAAREASAKRSKGLLSASDGELAKLEAALASADREAARCDAALAQLEHDLHELEEAEALAAIELTRTNVEKRAADFADTFLAAYAEHAAPLALLMREYAEIEAAISSANSDALEFHRQRGSVINAPAPVRPVADRVSAGRSLLSVHLAGTRIVPGPDHAGFGDNL